MAHSLSWAFTNAITKGVMENMKAQNAHLFAQSICESEEEESEVVAMSFDDLSGTMMISFVIMLFGFLVMLSRHYLRQHKRRSSTTEAAADQASAVTETETDMKPQTV